MNTNEVLNVIATERNYQGMIGNKPKTIGEEILLCEVQLRMAADSWQERNSSIGNGKHTKTMAMFRRICGNLVRCMEQHGTGGNKNVDYGAHGVFIPDEGNIL